jgi:Ca2+-dependent lipid-binding protein
MKDNKIIEINVWDYDKVGFDDLIGTADVEVCIINNIYINNIFFFFLHYYSYNNN